MTQTLDSRAVLDFWFSGIEPAQWWKPDPAFDERRFVGAWWVLVSNDPDWRERTHPRVEFERVGARLQVQGAVGGFQFQRAQPHLFFHGFTAGHQVVRHAAQRLRELLHFAAALHGRYVTARAACLHRAGGIGQRIQVHAQAPGGQHPLALAFLA